MMEHIYVYLVDMLIKLKPLFCKHSFEKHETYKDNKPYNLHYYTFLQLLA
jgi:hypothetical protein